MTSFSNLYHFIFQAHVYYENIDAAQAAVQEMRGHPLGGPDKRLRIDFADLDVVPGARRDYEHIDSKHTVRRSIFTKTRVFGLHVRCRELDIFKILEFF